MPIVSDDSARPRTFSGQRKVRLGDVTPTGRLRLDALTRYTQDVSDDDTTDAGLDPVPGWVVRRTTVAQERPAVLGETIELTTHCSGLGRRWAERRLQIVGDRGARYDVATLWICVDPVTGRPVALTEQFLRIYGPSAGERRVTARQVNPKPPAGGERLARWPWPLRTVDFDTLGHVNNAAYWAVAEEALAAGWAAVGERFEATVEYSAGLEPTDQVTIASHVDGEHHRAWWLTADATVAASLTLRPGSA